MKCPRPREWVFVAVLALSSATSTKGTAATQAADAGNDPVLERLVDVGGYRLYLKCIGVGGPTVILEAGLGGSSKTWDKVVPVVSTLTRVCSYDRPNEGKSDPAPRAIRSIGSRQYIKLRRGREIVADLHTLLAKAAVDGPYVFVGHSIGGLYAILYANQHPTEIVGMVLVDASHPDQIAREEALMTPEQARHDHEGLQQNEEGVDIDEVFAEARASHWHSTIPLYVLVQGVVRPPPPDWSAEQWAKKVQLWRELQADHARRSPNSRIIVAEKSGHGIPNDQPDLVIDAITRVVNLAKSR